MPKITRLAFNGWPNSSNLESIIYRSLMALKDQIEILLVPGGTLMGDWPEDLPGQGGWESNTDQLEEIIKRAAPLVQSVLSQRVQEAAVGKARYLTIGVDLRSLKIKTHVELVAFVDLINRKILRWTGKSYPTTDQELSLFHITDLKSHCLELENERFLILGCHDLNIYNGRARANQNPDGPRYRRCQDMLALFDKFQPTCILHHPHATDTWRSWNQSWVEIQRRYPHAIWASAITWASSLANPRVPLNAVLGRTHYQGAEAFDVIVKGKLRANPLQRQAIPNYS